MPILICTFMLMASALPQFMRQLQAHARSHLTLGVCPDLWTGGQPVNLCVCWVVKLLQDVGVWSLCSNFFCLLHRALHGLPQHMLREMTPAHLCVHPGTTVMTWAKGCFPMAEGSERHLCRVCEDQLCAKRLQEDSSLHRHGGRHGEDQFVSFGRCYEGQPNACVATGRLHQSGLACTTFVTPLKG